MIVAGFKLHVFSDQITKAETEIRVVPSPERIVIRDRSPSIEPPHFAILNTRDFFGGKRPLGSDFDVTQVKRAGENGYGVAGFFKFAFKRITVVLG